MAFRQSESVASFLATALPRANLLSSQVETMLPVNFYKFQFKVLPNIIIIL